MKGLTQLLTQYLDDVSKRINKQIVVVASSNIINSLSGNFNYLHPFKLKTNNEFLEEILISYDDAVILRYALNNDLSFVLSKTLLESSSKVIRYSNEVAKLYDDYQTYIAPCFNKDLFDFSMNYYKDKHLVIVGQYGDNDNLNQALKVIESFDISYESVLLKDLTKTFKNKYNLFSDYYDEVVFAVNEINKILNDEKYKDYRIVINTPETEYLIKLKEVLKLYGISYNCDSKCSLLSITIVKEILNNVFNSITSSIEFVSKFNEELDKLTLNNHETKVVKSLANSLKAFAIVEMENVEISRLKALVYEIVRITKINQHQKQIANVDIENVFDNIYDDKTFKFILNFNQDKLPKTFKDDGYLSDSALVKLNEEINTNYLTSTQRNIINRTKVIDYIKSNNLIYLSSSLRTMANHQVVSSIFESVKPYLDLDYCLDVNGKKTKEIKINERMDVEKINGINYLRLSYKQSLDNYITYGTVTENLNKANYIFKEELKETLKEYDNSFKIEGKTFENLTLSYTTINEFYECPFKYYLNRILKIKKEEFEENSNFNLKLGSAFHYCVEKIHEVDSVTKEEISNKINEYIESRNLTLSKKEELYFRKFIPEFIVSFKMLLEFEKESKYKVYGREVEFNVDLNNNHKFTGRVDKVYNNGNYYSIVDYKTKNVSIGLNDIANGLNLQLPSYIYLIRKNIESSLIQGIYLESILRSKGLEKSKLATIISNSRLKGYINDNRSEVENFDYNFNNENRFYGVSVVKKDDTYSSAFDKVKLNDDEFDRLYKLTCDLIDKASNEIYLGNFAIAPTKTKENNGCRNCKFKDICFNYSKYVEQKGSFKDLNELKSYIGHKYGN